MPLLTPPTLAFPTYLIPNIPFRRRRSRQSSSTIDFTSSSPPPPRAYLNGSHSLLRCSRCLAHLCPTTSIISKGFTGRHGRAYLVAPPPGLSDLPNTRVHRPTPRMLVTGAHTVSDISCVPCGVVLGWKYVDAEEESQKYKVGMCILETRRVVRSVVWEGKGEGEGAGCDGDVVREEGAATVCTGIGVVDSARKTERKDSGVGMDEEGEVEFDSEDEEECEDMFMGVWNADTARKRRKARAWVDEKDMV